MGWVLGKWIARGAGAHYGPEPAREWRNWQTHRI